MCVGMQTNNKAKKKTTMKGKSWFFILIPVIILSVVPFFILAMYNHPSADDFCYSRNALSMGFWQAQIDYFTEWTGRYTATALLTINPIDYTQLTFYRALPVMLLILFGFSIYLFFYKLLPNANRQDRGILSFIVFFLYISKVPDITEAFYWMAGSLTYQLATILTILLCALIIHTKEQKETGKKTFFTFLCVLLCISIVGLNEISLIILNGVLFLWLVIDTYRNKALNPFLLVLLLITIGSSLVSILSPGNQVRMSEKEEKFRLWYSLSFSVKYARYAIMGWLPMTILLVGFFAAPLARIAERLKTRLHLPRISLLHMVLFGIFLLGFISLCFFPSLWTQNGPPPARTVNVIFILFIFGILALAMSFLQYLKRYGFTRHLFTMPVRIISGLLIVASVVLTTNNVRAAYTDLLTGTVQKYQVEMEQRYKQLSTCTSNICVVPGIKNRPLTIFAYDLARNSLSEEYYYNQCLSDYFQKSYIKIEQ